jgi:hypothetical protein
MMLACSPMELPICAMKTLAKCLGKIVSEAVKASKI